MENTVDQNVHDRGVIFLGFCERTAYIRDGNTNIFKWNVLGLRNVVLSHVFPISLNGWSIGLAVTSRCAKGEHRLRITDEHGDVVGSINLTLEQSSPEVDDAVPRQDRPVMLALEHGWTPVFLPLRHANMIVQRPGKCYLSLVFEEESQVIGEAYFAVLDPPPLTPERIAAIRSDPQASKVVRVELGYRKCQQGFRAYAALDRSDRQERQGCIWYKDIPDQFVCRCGATKIDLSIMRRNLHGLLGYRLLANQELSFVPMYEKNAIENIRSSFALLLKSRPKEEALQEFIEENPILLHQFPADQIFFKPPILTFFVSDIAIVTPQKELILVELEKATTRLMKKDGGVAAPLSHAFDQVLDWLHVVDEHRLAVLDSLKIDRDLVSSVRGVVIAGRDEGYDAQHLRRLKGADRGRITLLTYDDILFALAALIRKMSSL